MEKVLNVKDNADVTLDLNYIMNNGYYSQQMAIIDLAHDDWSIIDMFSKSEHSSIRYEVVKRGSVSTVFTMIQDNDDRVQLAIINRLTDEIAREMSTTGVYELNKYVFDRFITEYQYVLQDFDLTKDMPETVVNNFRNILSTMLHVIINIYRRNIEIDPFKYLSEAVNQLTKEEFLNYTKILLNIKENKTKDDNQNKVKKLKEKYDKIKYNIK